MTLTENGEPKAVKKWMQNVELYLNTNAANYDNDLKRVAFALSFINGGSTDTWKEVFIQKAARNTKAPLESKYGTWDDFKEQLFSTFVPAQEAGSMIAELNELKQGDKKVDEYITMFRLLTSRSGITEDPTVVYSWHLGLFCT